MSTTTSRRRAKAVTAPGIPEGVADAPMELKAFSQEEMLRMRVADLEGQLAVTEKALSATRKAFMLSQIDPKGMLAVEDKKHADAQLALAAARSEYRAALEKACARLGLDPDTVSFDPQTGVVQLG